jgi:hypothetical protein
MNKFNIEIAYWGSFHNEVINESNNIDYYSSNNTKDITRNIIDKFFGIRLIIKEK